MLWLKAFHIIAVICWFAALFYLPRLFIYHALSEDKVSRDRFKVMEAKLYSIIAWPSMLVTLVLGLGLLHFNPSYYLSAGWMHAKLTLVLLCVVYHFACRHFMLQLRDDKCQKSHKFFRVFNEAPVLLLVPIVILVVVKPF
ncbi:protoporphyrinogen oxidase HemJ [Simiduia litorea]|uniref:protoporphyrinogen oxidase HemJ n=1 Tax=Simiduia litorea TaxID=1435348 RepID=UPI0036F2BE13